LPGTYHKVGHKLIMMKPFEKMLELHIRICLKEIHSNFRRILETFRTKVPAHLAGIFFVGSESIGELVKHIETWRHINERN